MLRLRLFTASFVLPLIVTSFVFAAEPTESFVKGRPMQAWVQQLRVKNPQAREEAVRALGLIGYPARSTAATLREIAERDDDASIRTSATESLRLVTTPPPSQKSAAALVIVSALNDEEAVVRKEAMLSIVRLGDDAWYAVSGLRTLTHIRTGKPKSDGEDFKKEARDAEEAINKTIHAPDLVKNLVSKDTGVRTTAEAKFAIVRDHPFVRQALLHAISDPKNESRAQLLDIWKKGYETAQ